MPDFEELVLKKKNWITITNFYIAYTLKQNRVGHIELNKISQINATCFFLLLKM